MDTTVCEDEEVTFSVVATGSLPISYQWQVDDGGGFADIGGATDADLDLGAVDASLDGNEYRVVVSNDCGSVTSVAALLTVLEAPSIDTDPAGTEVCEGDDALFTVVASGFAPLSYQWQVDDGGGFSDLAGETAATLTITAATPAQDGNAYRVIVSNLCDMVTSASAVLTVFSNPVITGPSDVQACDGESATFSVTVVGSGPFDYQWQRDSGSGFADIAGATADMYTTDPLSTDDDGDLFRVVVIDDNGCTATSSSALLTINLPPSVTAPADAEVNVTQTAMFSVIATGNDPFTYQWQVDDGMGFMDIAGATADSYTTPPAMIDDDGSLYRCVVTDANGCVTISANATLTVVSGLFIRGDIDGNGTVFALVDALYLLEWAFTAGPAPQCDDAADVDDNGVLFPLIDALALLDWAFKSGPVPPAPSPPDGCGPDGTPEDPLGCDMDTCTVE